MAFSIANIINGKNNYNKLATYFTNRFNQPNNNVVQIYSRIPGYLVSISGTYSSIMSYVDPTNGNTYLIYAFTGSGSITVTNNFNCDILAIGGGGAGGSTDAGGGGAGGMVFYPGLILPAGTYSITVGNGAPTLGGGNSKYNLPGLNGGNTTFGNIITALGGGGGGTGYQTQYSPKIGGCGGGAGSDDLIQSSIYVYTGAQSSQYILGNPSSSSYSFGNNGGNASSTVNVNGGGGGGGIGGVGANNGGNYIAGNGGPGLYQATISSTTYNFTNMYNLATLNYGQKISYTSYASAYYFGGGGGGGIGGNTTGGLGGGGSVNNGIVLNGIPYTGSGGGGGSAGFTAGGAGGSGILLLRTPYINDTYTKIGLLGDWNFGLSNSYPGSGNIITDLSGNGYNLTLTLNSSTGFNSNGKYMNFANNTYARTSLASFSSSLQTSGLTIEVLINFNIPINGYNKIAWILTTLGETFLMCGSQNMMDQSSAQYGYIGTWNGSGNAAEIGVKPITGNWYHIVLVWTNTNQVWYINNNIVANAYLNGSGSYNLSPVTTYTYIGLGDQTAGSGAGLPFNLAYARFYNTTLNSQQIAQNYAYAKYHNPLYNITDYSLNSYLLAYYDFNNNLSYTGGSTIYDLGPNKYNGTLVNTSSYSQSPAGITISTNSYLSATISSTNFTQTGITMEILFYYTTTSLSGGPTIIDLNNGSSHFNLWITQSGGIGLINQTIVATPSPSLVTNNWYHIVLSFYSNGTQTLTNTILYYVYINGIAQTVTNNSFSLLSNATQIVFNNYGTGNSFGINGYLALGRIYNIPLSPTQILINYNNIVTNGYYFNSTPTITGFNADFTYNATILLTWTGTNLTTASITVTPTISGFIGTNLSSPSTVITSGFNAGVKYTFTITPTGGSAYSSTPSVNIPNISNDPYYNLTVLFLKTQNSALDSSTYNVTMNTIGTPTYSSSVYYSSGASIFGTYSLYTGASSFTSANRLDTPNNARYLLTNNDFTIEFWFNSTSSATQRIMGNMFTNPSWSTPSWVIGCYGGNIGFETNQKGRALGSASPFDGKWHHFAAVRSGQYVTTYVDGIQDSLSSSYSGVNIDGSLSSVVLSVGGSGNGTVTTEAFNGYLENVKVTIGVARYNVNFGVPSATYLYIAGVITSFTATFNISTGVTFNWSGYGLTNVSINISPNNIGSQNPLNILSSSSTSGSYVFSTVLSNTLNTTYTFTITPQNGLTYSGSPSIVTTYVPVISTFTATYSVGTGIVLTWTGYYLSSVSITSDTIIGFTLPTTFTSSPTGGTTTIIPQFYSSVSSYTFNITFSITPTGGSIFATQPTITAQTLSDTYYVNTAILLHADNNLIDNSLNNYTMTPVGTINYTTSYKFGTNAFDFTRGRYIRAPGIIFDRNSFTIECWINPYVQSKNQICGTLNASFTTKQFCVGLVDSSNILGLYLGSEGGALKLQSIQLPSYNTGTYYHIALVRNYSDYSYTFYFNGQNVNSAVYYNSASLDGGIGQPFAIGGSGFDQSANETFSGLIDDFRVTIGVARYTANFTVPSAPFPNNALTSIVQYPPAALTGSITTISGKLYGNYTYTVSNSSSFGSIYDGWHAFDYSVGSDGTFWVSNQNYDNNTGILTVGNASKNGISGEWLQIQLSVAIGVVSYRLTPRNDVYSTSGTLNTWTFMGSNDGTTWTNLHSQSGITLSNWISGVYNTYYISSPSNYTYYAIVINKINGIGGSGYVCIGELQLYAPTQVIANPSASGSIIGVSSTTSAITVSFTTINTNAADTVTIYQASTISGTPTAISGLTPVLASSGTITCSPTDGSYIFLVVISAINGTFTSSAWGTAIAYPTPPPTINLVLASNINNTGTLSSQVAVSMPTANTPQFTTQSGKTCLNINSGSAVLYIPYGSVVPYSFTVSMWFYKTTTGLTDFFGIGNSALTSAYFNTDSFSGTTCTFALLGPNPTFDYVNNQWNHLAIVVSAWNTASRSVNVYLNGVAPPTTSTNLPYTAAGNFANWVGNANTFTIGTNGDAGTNSLGRLMIGYICKFQVYDQVLNSRQINSIYSAG